MQNNVCNFKEFNLNSVLRIFLAFITLVFANQCIASTDFALNCKRKYQRGTDYYIFFSIGGKAAIASKTGYPVLDSKEGIMTWEDLRLQPSTDKSKKNWYLTVKQYPVKSNYGDRREWFVEQGLDIPPKIYLRLSLNQAKDYDDRVVIYDIVCEPIENAVSIYEETKSLYRRDLELKKYKNDVYSNYGFQKGFNTSR